MAKVNLIAEIGGNHEGNFDYAIKLTDLAISSAADSIKFQLYTGSSIVNKLIDPSRFEHFSKFELTKNQHIEIANRCIKNGKEYLASVWDKEMLSWIDPYLERYKVGSGDLTNKTLLYDFAKRGKPIILSTGLSTLQEVINSIEYIREVNPVYNDERKLSVMQCTSMYPITDTDANLAVISSLKNIDNITIGYSDHTVDSEALYSAVILGARVLEFHFTDTREGKEFRDHQVSLQAEEVNDLSKRINRFFKLFGSSEKVPLDIEIENGHVTSFRRALYLNQDVKAGTTITKHMISSLRPNKGISAWDIDKLIGLKSKTEISKLQILSYDMFEK